MAGKEWFEKMAIMSAERKQKGELELLPASSPIDEASCRGRIAILAFGTRGDFQPYLALSLELRRRNYHTRIYGSANNRTQAKQYGAEFKPLDFDLEYILSHHPLFVKAMTDGDVATFLKAYDDSMPPHMYQDIFGVRALPFYLRCLISQAGFLPA